MQNLIATADMGAGKRGPGRAGLARDVDHVGFALRVDVRERVGHGAADKCGWFMLPEQCAADLKVKPRSGLERA